MLRQLGKILRVGVPTEPAPEEAEFAALGVRLRARAERSFAGSVAIRAVDAGSCNGCELELHALGNVFHAVERYGVHFVASPRHADLLLVTGPVARHMQVPLLRCYDAMPEPRLVVAAGECACSGGEFGVSYASCGPVSAVVPVDAFVPGCPPTPLALLAGLLEVTGRRRGR